MRCFQAQAQREDEPTREESDMDFSSRPHPQHDQVVSCYYRSENMPPMAGPNLVIWNGEHHKPMLELKDDLAPNDLFSYLRCLYAQ